MSFYLGSIVFIAGSIVSISYLQPNLGFICCGVIVSALFGKSIAK